MHTLNQKHRTFTSHSTQNRSFQKANLLAWYRKKPNTTKAHIHQSKELYYNKINTKKLKPALVVSYDIRPGNQEGLFQTKRAYSGFGSS